MRTVVYCREKCLAEAVDVVIRYHPVVCVHVAHDGGRVPIVSLKWSQMLKDAWLLMLQTVSFVVSVVNAIDKKPSGDCKV